jgi:hypothetical protein
MRARARAPTETACMLHIHLKAHLFNKTSYVSGVSGVKEVEGFGCKIKGILLHGLKHVSLTNDCLAF